MKFVVYSRRWSHNDSYEIKKTDKGWFVTHLTIKGDCDKQGKPYLMENLDHDCINYPEALGEYLEYVWDKSTEENWTEDKIQEKLNEVSEWTIAVEKSSPSSDFFKGYN